LSGLLGQGPDFARLLRDAAALRLPHGLILEGLPGAGKSTAARQLAATLLGGGDPARERRAWSGLHADLHLVELPADRQDIPVDRIRELQAELERRPVEGGARVALVDPADRLNEQGQNALLKTLEEPGADTFLILVTSRPEALLETVRSRCRRLRVRPLPPEELRAALTPPPDASPDEIGFAVAAAGGSLGLCRLLLESEARALSARLAAFLAAPSPLALGAVRGLLDGVTGRTETEQRVALVCRLLGAQLRVRAQAAVGAMSGVAGGGEPGYGSPFVEPWLSAVEAVFDAEQDLALGIPAGQVLEGLFLRLVDRLCGGDARVP
jgi:DNA polymerase-3 subunit delta'